MDRRRVFKTLKLTAPASGEPMAMSSMLSNVNDVVILIRFCTRQQLTTGKLTAKLPDSEDVACIRNSAFDFSRLIL